jgi:hypothetical protein
MWTLFQAASTSTSAAVAAGRRPRGGSAQVMSPLGLAVRAAVKGAAVVAVVAVHGELSGKALVAVAGTGTVLTAVGLVRGAGAAAGPVGRSGVPWLMWLAVAVGWELPNFAADGLPTMSGLIDPVLANRAPRGEPRSGGWRPERGSSPDPASGSRPCEREPGQPARRRPAPHRSRAPGGCPPPLRAGHCPTAIRRRQAHNASPRRGAGCLALQATALRRRRCPTELGEPEAASVRGR